MVHRCKMCSDSSIGRGSHTDNFFFFLGGGGAKNALEQLGNGLKLVLCYHLIQPIDPFGTISIDYQS